MFDPSAVVTAVGDLEAAVGRPPKAIMLKSIRALDEHCRAVLARSPAAVMGTTTGDGALQVMVVGGDAGFAAPRSDTVLDLGDLGGRQVVDGSPAGLLALVPGYGETLRVNGRLRLDGGRASLEVEEAFLHCAKAILRSKLWAPAPVPSPGTEESTVAAFLAASPFVLVVSTDGDGHADVSPKGDPPGLVRALDPTTIAIADRPGNRRTDTLHNLVDDPRVALLALRPGSDQVVEVRGSAQVSTDPALLTSMRLRNRTPKAAIVIDVDASELRDEPGLAAAALWDPSRHVDDGALPRAATIWADHVRSNVDSKVARRLVGATALAAGVAVDYRTNL